MSYCERLDGIKGIKDPYAQLEKIAAMLDGLTDDALILRVVQGVIQNLESTAYTPGPVFRELAFVAQVLFINQKGSLGVLHNQEMSKNAILEYLRSITTDSASNFLRGFIHRLVHEPYTSSLSINTDALIQMLKTALPE